jgi:hypothetical protein
MGIRNNEVNPTIVESASSSARLIGSSLGRRGFKAELLPIELSLEML